MRNLCQERLRTTLPDLESIAKELNSSKPEEGIYFDDKRGGMCLRIKNKFNEALVYHLDQQIIDITKKSEKGNHYYWINFQDDLIFLKDDQIRSGIHIIGKNTWKAETFKPFTEGSKDYNALSIPLKNFGPGAMLYIYNQNQ